MNLLRDPTTDVVICLYCVPCSLVIAPPKLFDDLLVPPKIFDDLQFFKRVCHFFKPVQQAAIAAGAAITAVCDCSVIVGIGDVGSLIAAITCGLAIEIEFLQSSSSSVVDVAASAVSAATFEPMHVIRCM